MTKTIADLDQSDENFRAVVYKIAKAAERAFIETGLQIPDYLEDITRSVAFDCVDEIVQRLRDVEDR